MKWSKVLSLSGVVLTGAVALTACGQKSTESKDQVLKWSLPAEISTMDPSLATDNYSFDMLSNSMEGLYRLGKDSKIEPGIATATKVSKDGLTYTFKLRKDAKWSNGDPVTAQDFVYSWRRTVDPKTGSQYAYLYEGIKNALDINEGKKPVEDLGIKAKGKYELVVTLDKQIPYFKLLMGFPSFFPQNQKAVEKFGKKYGTSAKYVVYNGPFKMEGWTGTNLSWSLKKNKNYWDAKKVKLDKIKFQVNKSTTTSYSLYQSDKLDQSTLGPEQAKQLKDNPDFSIVKNSNLSYLELNQNNKFLANKKIRQAISYAIDRKTIAKTILGSGTLPAKCFVSQGLAKHDGKDFTTDAATKAGVTYDKALAQKLFKEGMQEVGETSFSVNILGDDSDLTKKLTEYLQSKLEQTLPGIKVSVNNIPFKTRLSRSEKGEFDIVLSAWGADFSDPISFLDLMVSGSPYNNGKWTNTEYDKLIQASKTTDAGDPDKRWDDLVKAAKLLNREQGVIPLVQRNTPQMLRSNVKDVVHNSAGVSHNWKEAYIK
ncbi:peptide ABC transporter substrate-binding protein [Ligilactobacillus ceti]|uniref:Oligopeptide ABC superfamily ATP binding cassette transporter, binding protein n=1 Tax=Ligilactobacillus ceti DSM 22408 TaxID=1122146 RepID=A0A0R2KPL4_9LACO|nr:peptide ABC transporter substrate-binding protein [Ligilactobacillus ceti]KRN88876.1 oligopeptide ABC superfamily ATP binding cassette transporter, binding protein [Ligilactobacillus ceti DSM 22408]